MHWKVVGSVVVLGAAWVVNAVFDRLITPYVSVATGLSDTAAQPFATSVAGFVPVLVWMVAIAIVAIIITRKPKTTEVPAEKEDEDR